MIYLRIDHTAPADTFLVGTMSNPTTPYLTRAEADDPAAIAHLAAGGIVAHYQLENPDDRICGSTWQLQADGSFVEVATGTPEQIAAALAEKHMADLRIKWAEKDAATKRQEAREAVRSTDDITTLADAQARIAALVQLIGEA